MKRTTETVNESLAAAAFQFRATGLAGRVIGRGAWVTTIGPAAGLEDRADILIDEKLNRYLRFSDGQIFACTNGDLEGKTEREAEDFRQELTGLLN